MATRSRVSRRRRIVDRGYDRLDHIFGRIQSIPSPSSPSESVQEQINIDPARPLVSKDLEIRISSTNQNNESISLTQSAMTIRGKRCRKQPIGKRCCDWATGLPEGLLDLIVERLSVADCKAFSKVCRSWKSVVVEASRRKPLRGSPWLVTRFQETWERISFYDIVQRQCWYVNINRYDCGLIFGSFQEWLIIWRRIGRTMPRKYGLSLLNPFTGAKIPLPSMFDEGDKLVLSGSPCEKNCVYLIGRKASAEFALWTLGARTWLESRFEYGQEPVPLEDVTFCGHCFYILTTDYNILFIDAAHASSTIKKEDSDGQINTQFYKVDMSETPEGRVFKYLLEFSDKILLVLRFFLDGENGRDPKTYSFKVYRLDFGRMAWVKVDDLGDQVLFLGKGGSRFFSAKEVGIMRGNCIYFTNDFTYCTFTMFARKKGREFNEWGIFSLDDSSIGNFSYPSEEGSLDPTWITAPLWW